MTLFDWLNHNPILGFIYLIVVCFTVMVTASIIADRKKEKKPFEVEDRTKI